MSSVIQICNLALSHIGAYRIQSFEENTKEARECRSLYDTARDAVLADHDWGFARKRINLALSAEAYTGWTYTYEYPTDCLVARRIELNTGTSTVCDDDEYSCTQIEKVEYEVAVNADLNGRVILTNQENAELVYTAKVQDTNLFDPLFIDSFSWRMAADLAQPIKGKLALQNQMLQQYLYLISRAKSSNASEDHKKTKEINSFVGAR